MSALKLWESCVYPFAGITGANSGKMHLVSYSSYAYNGIQQYRMVKGKVAMHSQMFAFAVPQIEKDKHSLIEQSVYYCCYKMAFN